MGVIADQIYGHLDQQKSLPEEQNECKKRSRGNNDLVYMDRAVIREVKSKKKNLVMICIDYKKAYDMVPHLWIKECLELFGVAEFSVCFSIDPISLIFRKAKDAYEFLGSREKINHLLFTDDLKIYSRNEAWTRYFRQ